MAEQLRAPAFIRQIEPYRAGKPITELAREKGFDPKRILKLASNENPLGVPESARKAAAAAISGANIYPDGNAYALKSEISKRFGVPMDWIVVGNGSDELMGLTCQVLLEPGMKTVFSQYYFSVYEIDTHACGSTPVIVPAKGFEIDLDAIVRAIDEKTRIVFLTTPNNPTGLTLSEKDVVSFLERVPSSVTVVLDEAYCDFVPKEERFDSIGLLKRYPNLMVARTFSKAYGLAGFRCGFGICAGELPELINRIRPPFNCNTVAQAAAAGCVSDDAFLERVYQMNLKGVAQLEEAFSSLGLRFIPTKSNFILVEIGKGAAALNEALLSRGIIIRPCASFGLPEWIRVSVGTGEQNERFIEALREELSAVRAGN